MNKSKIYTVHYGSDQSPTLKFTKSITPFLNENLKVVIINNSKEIDLSHLSSEHITIINAEQNLGYFGAVKYGTEKTGIEDLDYIIICNNDVLIKNTNFFDILDKKLEEYDIIAPSIVTPAGVEQNPHRQEKPSGKRKIFQALYFSNYIISFILNNLIILKKKLVSKVQQAETEREIFAPHGAFMILKSTYFKAGGCIEEVPFLYGEEDSVAAMAYMSELRTGFVPQLQVLHEESVTIGKMLSYKNFKHQKSGYKHTLKKYPSIYSIWK